MTSHGCYDLTPWNIGDDRWQGSVVVGFPPLVSRAWKGKARVKGYFWLLLPIENQHCNCCGYIFPIIQLYFIFTSRCLDLLGWWSVDDHPELLRSTHRIHKIFGLVLQLGFQNPIKFPSKLNQFQGISGIPDWDISTLTTATCLLHKVTKWISYISIFFFHFFIRYLKS